MENESEKKNAPIRLPVRMVAFPSGAITIESSDGASVVHIYGPNEKLNYEQDRRAIAEFIVRAVNAYERQQQEIERLHADRRALADAETKQIEQYAQYKLNGMNEIFRGLVEVAP